MIEYLDFEIEIAAGNGSQYPVAVTHSPAGEAREVMRLPFAAADLEDRLKAIEAAVLAGGARQQMGPAGEDAVQSFGQALFDALFAGEVRTRYDVSCGGARLKGKGLRIRLRIGPPELAALPWEFLFDSRQDDYVCLSRKTPLVRYTEAPQPVEPLPVSLPLRVLAMVANPSDLDPLDTAREQDRIAQALSGLKGRIELTWLEGSSWRDLQRAMGQGPWHVFHFIGHGGFDPDRSEGLVALTGDDGRAHILDATQLARLLADQDSLRLVVLNSCEGARGSKGDVFSSTASILVRRGIPAVLAMQYEITDEASIELARVFYENVAQGLPVDAAVSEARKAVSIDLPDSVEWGTPVLFMRSPDGLLFTPVQGQTAEARPATASGAREPGPVDANPDPAGPEKGGAAAGAPPPARKVAADPQTLYPALAGSFNEDELRDLCFRAGVDYEDLPGGTRAAKARELVLYMQRRSRLAELADLVARLRPSAGA